MPVSPSLLPAAKVATLRQQRTMRQTSLGRDTAMRRLSTGSRVSTGRDDPAALIASQTLRAERLRVTQAQENAARAVGLTNTIDAALAEVLPQLRDMQRLVLEASNGVSPEELAASQREIDDLAASVDRIFRQTTFAGRRVFDEPLIDYQGLATPFDFNNEFVGTDNIPGHTGTDGGGNVYANNFTIEEGGAALHQTGDTWQFVQRPTATITADTRLSFEIDIDAISPAATIGVSINSSVNGTAGIPPQHNFRLAGDGPFGFNWDYTHYDSSVGTRRVTLDLSQQVGTNYRQIHFIANGQDANDVTWRDVRLYEDPPQEPPEPLQFAISANGNGATTDFQLPALALRGLGERGLPLTGLRSGGDLDLLGGNFQQASISLAAAVQQVAEERGRVGAFAGNTLETVQRSLARAEIESADGVSTVADADFAEETAELSRLEVLSQTAPELRRVMEQVQRDALVLLEN